MRTLESYNNAIQRLDRMIDDMKMSMEPMKDGEFKVFSLHDGVQVDETASIIARDERVIEELQDLMQVIEDKRDQEYGGQA